MSSPSAIQTSDACDGLEQNKSRCPVESVVHTNVVISTFSHTTTLSGLLHRQAQGETINTEPWTKDHGPENPKTRA